MKTSRVLQNAIWILAGLLAALASSRLAGDEIEGFTEPYRDIDVAAPEVGSIAQILVKEGDRVKAGQVLACLDESVLEASLEIAKAEMNFQGRLNSALAELRLQSELLNKLQELRQQNFANPREVEKTLADKDAAEARVKSAREELAVKALEYKRVQTQLVRRRMCSPIDGIVTRVLKNVGEFVSPSDPVVVKVVQLDPMLVVFSVPTAKARQITPAQTVRVQIEGAPSPVDGVVEFVSPTADPQSGTARVRVRIPNDKEILPSGATCRLPLPDAAKSPAATK